MQEHRNGRGLRRVGQQPIQKAARLVVEGRVRLADQERVYIVQGDTATYRVIAGPEGIFCPCQARDPLCSHVLSVAHVREQERQTDRLVEWAGNGNGAAA